MSGSAATKSSSHLAKQGSRTCCLLQVERGCEEDDDARSVAGAFSASAAHAARGTRTAIARPAVDILAVLFSTAACIYACVRLENLATCQPLALALLWLSLHGLASIVSSSSLHRTRDYPRTTTSTISISAMILYGLWMDGWMDHCRTGSI